MCEYGYVTDTRLDCGDNGVILYFITVRLFFFVYLLEVFVLILILFL